MNANQDILFYNTSYLLDYVNWLYLLKLIFYLIKR